MAEVANITGLARVRCWVCQSWIEKGQQYVTGKHKAHANREDCKYWVWVGKGAGQ